MKKRITSAVSFVISVCLILSVITIAPFSVSAASSDSSVAASSYEFRTINVDLKVGQEYSGFSKQSRHYYTVERHLYYIKGDKAVADYDEYYDYSWGYYGVKIKALKPGTLVLNHVIHQANISHVTHETTYNIKVSSAETTLSTPKITGFYKAANGVQIKWGAVSGAQRYRVYYKSGNSWKRLGDTYSTSYTDTGLSIGAKRTYTVRCMNSSGSSFTSSYNKTGWSYTNNLATPKITGLSSTSSGIKINWNKVSGAAKYRLFRHSSSGWTKLCDVTGTSYTDTKVKSGTTYKYTVRCINSSAKSYTSSYYSKGWSHTYRKQVATPSINSFSSSADGVKISWKAVSQAEKYRLYRYNNGWTKIGDSAGTSFTDKNVSYGKSYRYTIRCISKDSKAFTSGYDSKGRTYTYKTNLPVPKITKGETVSNGIKISWGAVAGVNKYRVFYKSNNTWVKIADTASTSFVDTNVVYGSSYTYTVRCLTSNGKGFSSSFDGSGKKYTYYSTPKITNAYLSSNSLYVNISDTHYSKYYKLWYYTSNGWYYIGSIDSLSGFVNGSANKIKPGLNYTFTVQGYNSNGSINTNYSEKGFTFRM